MLLLSQLRMPGGNLHLQTILEHLDSVQMLFQLLVHEESTLGLFLPLFFVVVVMSLIHAPDLGLQMLELVQLGLEVTELLAERDQLLRVEVRLLRKLPQT